MSSFSTNTSHSENPPARRTDDVIAAVDCRVPESTFESASFGKTVSLSKNSLWIVATAQSSGTYHQQQGRPCEDALGYALTDTGDLHLAVADGVGSGARGDICSRAAVNHVIFPSCGNGVDRRNAETLFRTADAAVNLALQGVSDNSGATMLAAVWQSQTGDAVVAHIGDSRVYSWKVSPAGDFTLTRLTLDHTYGNLGEMPPHDGHPTDPSRMIGLGYMYEPDISLVSMSRTKDSKCVEGWLLCTDGVHGFLQDSEIERVLKNALLAETNGVGVESHLKNAASNILDAALEAGSHDDITVLVSSSAKRWAIHDNAQKKL